MFIGTIWFQRWKTYKRASNAHVIFIVCLKSVTNYMLFCCKSELCCDFELLGAILMDFNLVIFLLYLKREKKKIIYGINVASLAVFRSYFAHSCCLIYFMFFLLQIHFCRKFTHLFQVKYIGFNPCLFKKVVFFHFCLVQFFLYFHHSGKKRGNLCLPMASSCT